MSIGAFGQSFTLIHDAPTHTILELRVQDFDSSVIQIDGAQYVDMRARGLQETGEPGGPMRLRAARLISLPENKVAKITVLSSKHQMMTLKHSPKFYRRKASQDALETLPAKFDEERYNTVTNEPILALSTPEYIGPIKTTLLRFNPLQYETSYRKARLTTSMVIRIDYVHSASTKAPVNGKKIDEESLIFYKNLFINKHMLSMLKAQASTPLDLIVADEALRESVTELISFKEEQGRSVIVRYFSDADAADIKTYIADQYRSARPPSNTILVGNIDKLPTFRHQGFWSDYPYSLLDGIYPDLSIGRIAAKNNNELKNMILKLSTEENVDRYNDDSPFADLGHKNQFEKIQNLEQFSGDDTAVSDNYKSSYYGDPAKKAF